jgi:hypothetical protein
MPINAVNQCHFNVGDTEYSAAQMGQINDKTVAATHSQVPEYWTGSFQPACNRSLISSPALISPSSTKSAPCPPTPFNRLQLPQTSSPAYPVASIGLRLSAVFVERMGLWGDDRRPKGATSIGR